MDLENLESQSDFWNQRWEHNQTGWHLPRPHDMLVEHLDLIAPPPDKDASNPPRTIFVPLSGKTLDISWLGLQKYKVVACELSSKAVHELFAAMSIEPIISQQQLASGRSVEVFETADQQIRVFRCNFFDLDPSFADVSAVFDRAALVALPAATREQYAAHMMRITHLAPQLLVTFEHSRTTAPPHSVPLELVKKYYGPYYDIELVTRKGISDDFIEVTYVLTPKSK